MNTTRRPVANPSKIPRINVYPLSLPFYTRQGGSWSNFTRTPKDYRFDSYSLLEVAFQ